MIRNGTDVNSYSLANHKGLELSMFIIKIGSQGLRILGDETSWKEMKLDTLVSCLED